MVFAAYIVTYGKDDAIIIIFIRYVAMYTVIIV